MDRGTAVLGGAAVGMVAMYMLDPQMGRRRQALLRDKITRSANVTREGLAKTWRDARNRAWGLGAEAVRRLYPQEPPSDEVLVDRIRAGLGFVVRHPSAIEVTVEQGRAILSGPVLADEVDRLRDTVARVLGVQQVEDHLDVHDEPGSVPGLQGDVPPRLGRRWDLFQTNPSLASQGLLGLFGGVLAVYGLSRRTLPATALAIIGSALLARVALPPQPRSQ